MDYEQRLYALFQRVVADSGRPAVTVSEDYKQRVIEDIGVPAEQLVAIPPGVDTPQPYDREQALDELAADLTDRGFRRDVPLITYIGRKDSEKGLDLLLYAAAILRRQGVDVQVAIAGPFGSAFYEDERRVVVLAGGPGVGPAIGIAERAIEDGGEAAVIYRDTDPIHGDRLERLAERSVHVSVLETDDDVVSAAGEVITGADDEQIFVYGFADFLDVATDAIEAAGGDSGGAKVENFG
ncbi:MAG: hypothetical protein ACOCUA_03300 [archaeon]